jgi:hypothetical protein
LSLARRPATPITKPVTPTNTTTSPIVQPAKDPKEGIDYEDYNSYTYTYDMMYNCDKDMSGDLNQREYLACSGKSDSVWGQLISRFDLNMDQRLSFQEA